MKQFIRLVMGTVSVMLLGTVVAFGQITIAHDDASNYGSWAGNGGFGFTVWDLWTQGADGYTGHIIGSSSGQQFGDIDVNGDAFAMYGNPEDSEDPNQANAQRFVTNTGSPEIEGRAYLLPGMKFNIDLAIAFRNGYKGIDLFDQSFNQLFNFNVSGNIYSASDDDEELKDWGYSQTSIFHISVEQVNSTQYKVSINRGTDQYTSTLRSGKFAGFKLYVGNTQDGNDLNNLFANNLKVTTSGTLQLTGTEGFRMLSSPVSSTYGDLLDAVWTQGATGSNGQSGNPNVFTWDKLATDGANTNWAGVTDLSGSLTAGNGLLAYIYADDDFDVPGSATWPKTLSVSGTENAVDAAPTLNSNADGWTLVGNPYASTIDFDEATKNDLTNVAYVWDSNSSSWKTWSGTSGDITDGLITSFQGFFVQNNGTAASPSITFGAASKSAGGSFLGKPNSTTFGKVRLEASGENLSNSMWLQFSEKGSSNAKVMGDALELQSLSTSYVELAAQKEEELFDIAHLSSKEDVKIPISFKTTESGTYTMSASNFEVPSSLEVVFHDYETGNSIKLDENFSYEFQASAIKAKKMMPLKGLQQGPIHAKAIQGNRFGLVITQRASVSNEPNSSPKEFSLEQNYPNPFNPTTRIQYSVMESGPVTLTVYNVMGQQVANLVSKKQSAGTYRVNWNAASMASGIYYYRLQAGNQIITRQMTLIK